MISLIRSVYGVAKTAYRKQKMKLDFHFLHNHTILNRTISILPNESILVLAPHADDEWVGCSQILISKSAVKICNMDMSGGDSEKLHKERFQEMTKIAKITNRELETISGTYDDKVAKLKKNIQDFRPRYIAVPFYFDWHDEHIEVMGILKDALLLFNGEKDVLMYQVSVPIPLEMITHCLQMNKEQHKNKWKTFNRIYKTQLSIPWIRFQYNERISGKFCGGYAAEVFVCEKGKYWAQSLEERIISESQRKVLISNLQDLKAVRDITKSIN